MPSIARTLTGLALLSLLAALVASCVALPKEMLADNRSLRQTALRFNVMRYASNEMVTAETNFIAGSNFYSNDNAKSTKSLTTSKEAYESALAKGLPIYVGEKQAENTNQKGKADTLKAMVASKSKYDEATALYNRALAAKAAADAVLPSAPTNGTATNGGPSGGDANYYQAAPANLTGKAKEKYDADRKLRREKLAEAAELMEQALVKFEEAVKESADKKAASDKALDEALGDLSETDKAAKAAAPKPAPAKKKAPAKK